LQCHSATVCNDFRSSQSSSSCFSSHHFSGGYWTRSSPEVKSGSSFVFTRSAHHIRNLVALTLHARAAAYTDSSIAYGIRMRSPTREARGLTGPRWLCRHQSLQKPAGPVLQGLPCLVTTKDFQRLFKMVVDFFHDHVHHTDVVRRGADRRCFAYSLSAHGRLFPQTVWRRLRRPAATRVVKDSHRAGKARFTTRWLSRSGTMKLPAASTATPSGP
jgi:hypothetical protein